MDETAQAKLRAKLDQYVTGEISIWDFRGWRDRWARELGARDIAVRPMLADVERALLQFCSGDCVEPELKRALWAVVRHAEGVTA
jgi:hypothetical protein